MASLVKKATEDRLERVFVDVNKIAVDVSAEMVFREVSAIFSVVNIYVCIKQRILCDT